MCRVISFHRKIPHILDQIFRLCTSGCSAFLHSCIKPYSSFFVIGPVYLFTFDYFFFRMKCLCLCLFLFILCPSLLLISNKKYLSFFLSFKKDLPSIQEAHQKDQRLICNLVVFRNKLNEERWKVCLSLLSLFLPHDCLSHHPVRYLYHRQKFRCLSFLLLFTHHLLTLPWSWRE